MGVIRSPLTFTGMILQALLEDDLNNLTFSFLGGVPNAVLSHSGVNVQRNDVLVACIDMKLADVFMGPSNLSKMLEVLRRVYV